MTTPSEFINMMTHRKRAADSIFQSPSLSAFMPAAPPAAGTQEPAEAGPPLKKPHLDLQPHLAVEGVGASVGRSSWWQLGTYQPDQVQEMFRDNSAAAASTVVAAAAAGLPQAQQVPATNTTRISAAPTTMNELFLQGGPAAFGDYSSLLIPHSDAEGPLDPTQQLQNNLIKQVMAIEALQQQQSLLSRHMATGATANNNMMNNLPIHVEPQNGTKTKAAAPKRSSQSKAEPGDDPKFRAYHAENWTERFEELLQFREQMGHCLVPNYYPENPALAQWVKRQRYQKKLKEQGKRSTLSDDREKVLDEAGMVWDSHAECWTERLQELIEYRRENGDCNVPSRYKENRQLAIWVKRQRRQYKFFMDKQPSSMTQERIETLEALGFIWDLRAKNK